MGNAQWKPLATGWLSGALLVAAAAVTQQPVSAQRGQTPAPANAPSISGDHITVVGCLVQLDTSAWRPGTSDPIPTGHPGDPISSGYALKDAVESTGAEPATGPVATRSDREFGITKGDVSVGRFAGQQVVIKGRRSTAPGGEAAADRTPLPPGHDFMLDVTAIRSISDSCPPRG